MGETSKGPYLTQKALVILRIKFLFMDLTILEAEMVGLSKSRNHNDLLE